MPNLAAVIKHIQWAVGAREQGDYRWTKIFGKFLELG